MTRDVHRRLDANWLGRLSRGLSNTHSALKQLKKAVLQAGKLPRLDVAAPPGGWPEPERYLAAVAIFKNEAPYLAEWIEFHRLAGVEHFYLYDNGSTDGSESVLAPFLDEGVATLIPWGFPWQGSVVRAQDLAYAHALGTFGSKWRWMACIDIDEFLFSTVDDSLQRLLQRYEDVPALLAFWTMFGFSGHDEPPAGLVVEQFTMRAPFPTLAKPKSIVQPAKVVGVSNCHLFDLRTGLRQGFTEAREVFSKTEGLITGMHAVGTLVSERLRLNHYFTRSRREFEKKVAGWAIAYPARASKIRRMVDEIEANAFRDDAAARFLPLLRERMSRHGQVRSS
jgi:hypothetical protein